MTTLVFDTLIFSNKLVEAGMPKNQADKIAEAQKDAFESQNQILQEKLDKTISAHVATKEDIWGLRQSIDLMHEKFEGKFLLLYWMLGSIFAVLISVALKIFL